MINTLCFETLGTFALVFVVLSTTSNPKQVAPGVAIGAVVVALAMTFPGSFYFVMSSFLFCFVWVLF